MTSRGQPSTDLTGTDWTREVQMLIDRHPSDVLGLMLSINGAFGFLPRNVLEHVAARTDVPVARLAGIASFYRTFRLQPRGEHLIHVCQGTACHVAGSGGLMRYLERSFDIGVGQTSADGRVTLESVACVGCCSLAPVVRFDGITRGRARSADIQALVRHVRPEPPDSEAI